MACATNLLPVSLGILLWTGEAVGFCASIFETQPDHTLLGQVMETVNVTDEFECHRKCIRNNICKSFNVHPPKGNGIKKTCEMNNQTRQMNPGQYKKNIGSSYHGSVEIACHSMWDTSSEQTGRLGLFPEFPGISCEDIRKLTHAKENGEYWIDPKATGHPFKGYCDMTTDGGGWLLVLNVVTVSSLYNQLSVKTSYRGITDYHSNKMVISTNATKELYEDLNFQQIRFHCSKQLGRTFHVVTAANSSGKAVVQYFSGLTDVLPDSCGSFERMEDDDSRLSRRCSEWMSGAGSWSSTGINEDRLYNILAFMGSPGHYWLLWDKNYAEHSFECDDIQVGVSSGDFWKVFVR